MRERDDPNHHECINCQRNVRHHGPDQSALSKANNWTVSATNEAGPIGSASRTKRRISAKANDGMSAIARVRWASKRGPCHSPGVKSQSGWTAGRNAANAASCSAWSGAFVVPSGVRWMVRTIACSPKGTTPLLNTGKASRPARTASSRATSAGGGSLARKYPLIVAWGMNAPAARRSYCRASRSWTSACARHIAHEGRR